MQKNDRIACRIPGNRQKVIICNKILEKLPDFLIVSQDDMKEKLFDQYGFDNMEEKVAIENQSWGTVL